MRSTTILLALLAFLPSCGGGSNCWIFKRPLAWALVSLSNSALRLVMTL